MKLLILALALSSPSQAGRLDLNYPASKPDPAMTIVHGLFIPGGGWLHVATHTQDARRAQAAQGIGAVFMAATAASMWAMVNNALKGDTRGLALGVGLTVGLRYADLWGSVRRAHVTRYENGTPGSREEPESAPPEREKPRRSYYERGSEDDRDVEPAPTPRRKSKSLPPVWLE